VYSLWADPRLRRQKIRVTATVQGKARHVLADHHLDLLGTRFVHLLGGDRDGHRLRNRAHHKHGIDTQPGIDVDHQTGLLVRPEASSSDSNFVIAHRLLRDRAKIARAGAGGLPHPVRVFNAPSLATGITAPPGSFTIPEMVPRILA